MTASTTTDEGGRKWPWATLDEREEPPDLPLMPREGWLSLIALAAMIIVVAIAIDDAGWVGTSPGTHASQTRFLPASALVSVLVGAWLARTRFNHITAHAIGALLGAIVLLYLISGSLSDAPAVEQRLHALNLSVSTFVYEVFVLGVRSSETSVFLLVMGALVWAAGQFAAFGVFRRHRAGPGIALAGLILLLNISITVRFQYVHLIVFVGAALLLLMRLNLFEHTREWRARGVRDVADISNSFLRYGATMVGVVLVGSILLAANASSAPLSRSWGNFDQQLLDIGYGVNRWLGGVTGEARGPNVLFTPTQTIRDFWQSSTEQVFSVTASDGVGRRWRGATYDSFDGRTWQQLDRELMVVDPGEPVFGHISEGAISGSGWEEVSVTVTPADFSGDIYVAPANPLTIDQPSEVLTNGAGGPFVAGKLAYGLQADSPYTLEAMVRKQSGADALTGSELAAAGRNYPQWSSRYTLIRPNSVGDTVAETAQQILASLPASQRDPYHIAVAVQDYLYRSGGFSYTTDVRGMCDGQKVVDCFLAIKRGYCEYFATAMVMLLRELGVPSRYVLGYLPGHAQADGTWLVDRSASHAWVEVFFPGYGWVEFDPTPGNGENGQSPTQLAEGSPVASPTPGTNQDAPSSFNPECITPRQPNCGPDVTSVTPPGPPSNPDSALGVMIAVLGLGAAGLLALGFVFFRRVPKGGPELAFNSISRLAARLGYGPQPAQTTYEYAERLGELVPVASADLHLIATAKVEATYARMVAGESMLGLVAGAYRRARVGLLRLIVRRPRVGRGPRSTSRPD